MTVLLALIIFPAAFYWTQIARRKTQVLRFRVRALVIYLLIALLTIGFLQSQSVNPSQAGIAGILAGLVAALLFARNRGRRSRYIPRRIRRAVIARDLKGERFDPAKHEVDHIVPYSKGGDHSERNLRVVPKKQNRQRGSKMPRLRDLM